MTCSLDFGDTLVVKNLEDPSQSLHLDMSRFYCRLFETTHDQSRDYLEEIMRWSGGNIDNYDFLSSSLMHCTAARRRYYGFKK